MPGQATRCNYIKHFAYVVHKLYENFGKRDTNFYEQVDHLAKLKAYKDSTTGETFKDLIQKSAQEVKTFLDTVKGDTTKQNVDFDTALNGDDITFEILPTRIGSDTIIGMNRTWRERVAGLFNCEGVQRLPLKLAPEREWRTFFGDEIVQ